MRVRPLALTMGEPAGIGPEITLKAWLALRGKVPFVFVGDKDLLAEAVTSHSVKIQEFSEESTDFETILPYVHCPLTNRPVPGKLDFANAHSVVNSIIQAVTLVIQGTCCALVTNPINKHGLIQGADFQFPGHTEFLASLAGSSKPPVMMLSCPQLRVVPTTIHAAIQDVPALLTKSLLEHTIRVTHAALTANFGLKNPRLAIAGLNPHAGENGAFGREEIDIIAPVLDLLRCEGMLIAGPLSADSMFHASARASYDVAICMYHDQALIPLKTLDFALGVNITLGLPFVRTSPDHGTALDIAGRGQADPSSLIEALKTAWLMNRTAT